ncbi:MAG TPA: hypothetical protein VII92_12465 [Anaerolineae bacterium]
MAMPLFTTKLYIPPPRPQRVQRPRLIECLNAGLRGACKLILISAPAGFGKTTLLSDWLNAKDDGGRPKAEFQPSCARQGFASGTAGAHTLAPTACSAVCGALSPPRLAAHRRIAAGMG